MERHGHDAHTPAGEAEPCAAGELCPAIDGPGGTEAAPASAGTPNPGSSERRGAPRRRLRDRIASLDRTDNPSLRLHELANLTLLVDDDLRQAALTIGAIERYVAEALSLVEDEAVAAEALTAHAERDDVIEEVEALLENLGSLRRRMKSVALVMQSRPRGGGAM